MQGFPRSDIDIPVVRADRHRLAGTFKFVTHLPIKIVSGNELLLDYRKVAFGVEFCYGIEFLQSND